jgi:hypothetical protein
MADNSAAHMFMVSLLLMQQPMLRLILVAAFQRGVHSKLAMRFDGTTHSSLLRWLRMPVNTVLSMADLPVAAGNLIPITSEAAMRTVWVEVDDVSDHSVSVYSVPLANFCGAGHTEAGLMQRITEIAAHIQADAALQANIEQIIENGHS